MSAELIEAVDAVLAAFGAPGDWGYGTTKGDALYALHIARARANPDEVCAAGDVVRVLRAARAHYQVEYGEDGDILAIGVPGEGSKSIVAALDAALVSVGGGR